MSVDVIVTDPRWETVDLQRLAQTATDAALAGVGLDAAMYKISLMGCDDTRIAELNSDFRAKMQATNVLSWPSEERGAMTDGETPISPQLPQDEELGDIAIAYDTCLREAAAADKEMTDHVTHLIIHGTLHLLGYDHIRDADAALMEGLEIEILGNLGLSNPYSA